MILGFNPKKAIDELLEMQKKNDQLRCYVQQLKIINMFIDLGCPKHIALAVYASVKANHDSLTAEVK